MRWKRAASWVLRPTATEGLLFGDHCYSTEGKEETLT